MPIDSTAPALINDSKSEESCIGKVQLPNSPSAANHTLKIRDGIFLGGRYGLGILVGFANMLVLTAWIGPHAYGLFVTAIGLSSFLANLTRAGADTYLVRREGTPDDRLYNAATTLIAIFSLLLVGAGLAAVSPLIHWYGNREFVLPYLATLATIPLAGLAGPPIAKLERNLNFQGVATIELGGQVLGLIVSVLLAWRHFGVWAPVAGVIAWQMWVVLTAHITAQLCPRPVFDRREIRAMLSFGLGYTLSQRVWQVRGLVNPLMVGRLAGTEAVAFVALAVRIGESLGFVRAAAGRLAVAGLAHVRHDTRQLQFALQKGVELQVALLGALLCMFALSGPYLLPKLFGSQWIPSLRIYPWLAAGVLINSIYNLQASALFVLGRQWTVLCAYCAHVILLGAATLWLVPRVGLRGYGWADLAACATYALLHRALGRYVELSYLRIATWCVAFGLVLFSMNLHARWIFWIPLGALIAVELIRRKDRNWTQAAAFDLRHSARWRSQPATGDVSLDS